MSAITVPTSWVPMKTASEKLLQGSLPRLWTVFSLRLRVVIPQCLSASGPKLHLM